MHPDPGGWTHHDDRPRMPAPDRWPAVGAPEYPGPRPTASWSPHDPTWGVATSRKSYRRHLIAAGAAIAVTAAGVAAGIVLSGERPSAPQPSPAPRSTPTSSPAAPVRLKPVQVVPEQVLPTDAQVKQATLLNLSKHGAVNTSSYPDQTPQPPDCGLAMGPIGDSTVGPAVARAGQTYADSPGPDFHANAFAFAGVLTSADDTASVIAKVTDVVQRCTGFSTGPTDSPLQWTVTNVKPVEHQVMWTDNQQTGPPWACNWLARATDNVLVAAMVCDVNPGDSAAALADVVVSNIATRK